MSENVLVLADMHIGNWLGLLHPKTPGVKLNDGQKYLWKCYQHMLAEIPERLDAVVLMDECNDGPSKPNNKYLTAITEPWAQRRAAKLVLEPVIERADEVWMLIGSAWHVGDWGQESLNLAADIGAMKWATERPAGHNLLWKLGNVVLDFAHHRSVVMVNRGMPLEREIRYRKIDDPLPKKLKGKAQIECIVRAHSHVFAVHIDRHMASIGCPSWQLPYLDFGVAKRAPARAFPDIGWILLTVTPGERPPVTVDWELYDYPKLAVYDRGEGKWISHSPRLP